MSDRPGPAAVGLPPRRGPVWRLQRAGLLLFRLLPETLRRAAVRRVAPSYTAGALVVVADPDGAVVLIRHSYRRDWGLPGGLLDRGEHPADAARREVREEIGLDVELAGAPRVVLDPALRRLDFVYRARVRPGSPGAVQPCSPELSEACWFPADAFPPLHPDAASALAALDGDGDGDGDGAVPYVPATERGRRR